MTKQIQCIRIVFGLWLMAAPVISMGAASNTQAWIEILQSERPLFEKARACQQLGEAGTSEAVPALAALLNHDMLSVYARTGLERIPGPEAAAALRDALATTQGTLKIGVIQSVAALCDEEAVPALSGLTRGSDAAVASAAMLALGRIASDQAVTFVMQALTSGPPEHRPDAAAACLLAAQHQLSQKKAESAAALYDAVLKAKVPASYHIGATRGAILSRTQDRIAFLVKQLRSQDPAIRDVAILTVRQNPSEAFADALNAEIQNAPAGLQSKMIGALIDCHNAQSLPIIRAKAVSEEAQVRMAALNVLSRIGGPDDAPTLIKVLLDNQGPEEVSLAMSILEQIGGPETDAMILKALSSATTSSVRIELIRLLGKRSATSATDELLHQAGDPDQAVSIAALQALRSLASPEDLPRLIWLTRQCTVESVRDAAANAVYSVCKDHPPVGPSGALILKALKAANVTAEKQAWIRVLSLLGYSDALPFMTATLQDADPDLVQSTISSLGRWPDPSPINALFQVVESHANATVRSRALVAVLQLATRAADQTLTDHDDLLAWFQRAGKAVQSVQEKRLLISGLGRVNHVESVRMLSSYLDDADVKAEAVYAIVNAAGPLAKGPDYKTVEAVLKKIPAVQDPRLRDQIAGLERDIKATRARLDNE
ncbi:MAG: HEAT repeat domain-containing protein [Phycisphaerae bacterium]|nr:HEAT repeat domain-containing protein [Phycisphaerae bacterium]